MNFLKHKVFGLLESQEFRSDNEIFLRLILFLALCLAFLTHLFFSVFYLINNAPFLVYVNIGSIVAYGLGFLLYHQRNYVAVGLLLTIEINLYAFVSILATGLGTGLITFYFLMLLVQASIPYAKGRTRIGAAVFGWACLTLSLFTSFLISPFAPLPTEIADFCAVMNIEITFFCMAAVLVIADQIRILIAEYRKLKSEEYRYKAHTDQLTKLYNRHFANSLWPRLSRDSTWAIAMVDIDDFKDINDRYGHNTGDDVLVDIASIVSKRLRGGDVVIRWGGEEFLILLQNVTLENAKRVLDGLRIAIETRVFTVGQENFSATVSAGICILDHEDIHGSITLCDQKLYESKRSGKNRVSI